jgi:DNA uptake protein ComE-like DNA-binding protein
MAQRHWLDPLARRLLQVTGQLPPDPPSAGMQRRGNRHGDASSHVAATPEPHDRGSRNRDIGDHDHGDLIEQELLALKLRHDPSLQLCSAHDVRQLAALGWRLDVNRATRADWLRLPGIASDQVDLLLRLQAGGVQLSGPDDLQRLLELPTTQLQAWLPVLAFRWYGEAPATATATPPPLDLNRASRQQLSSLGLSAERCHRLLCERARQPFEDLADLQQRLHLPPALVEILIGKVRFGRGPIGPVLPSPRRRAG